MSLKKILPLFSLFLTSYYTSILTPYSTIFALDINKINLDKKDLQLFIKAYLQGREDAEEDLAFLKQKTISRLKDIYITKKLIKEGDIRIIVKEKIMPLSENEFRVVKVYELKIIKPEELAKDKAFIQRIEEKKEVLNNYEGYWLYMRIDRLSKPLQGLIEYVLKQEGLKPKRLGKILLVDIYPTKAEAQMWQKLLKEKYNIDFAIGEVNKGKALDPLIEEVLNYLK